MTQAREKLKQRYSQNRNSGKLDENINVPDQLSEEEKTEDRPFVWNHSIRKSITKKDMDKIDVSTTKDTGVDLEAEMEKYLGGDDEVLAGFYSDDDDTLPSFDSLNAGQQQ